MTPAFTITITGENITQLHANLRDLLPSEEEKAPANFDFQTFSAYVERTFADEGYEVDIYKKGDKPGLPVAEKKKEEARAKLREDLVASLKEGANEGTLSPEVKAEETAAPVEETEEVTKPKRGRPPKSASTSNGAEPPAEKPEDLKRRVVDQLQKLFSGGKKAEVMKLLAEFGKGAKNFSAIPAEEFGPIAIAAGAI